MEGYALCMGEVRNVYKNLARKWKVSDRLGDVCIFGEDRPSY